MRPIGVLLFVWLLVSLSVYAYRIHRRVTEGPKAEREARATGGPGQLADAVPPEQMGPATRMINNPLAGFEGPRSEPGPANATTGATSDPMPAAPLESVSAPPPVEGANPATSIAPAQIPVPEGRVERVPVAEAVSGIQMPCDLVPLLGDATRIDPFDVAFVTTTFDATRVHDEIAAELRRLGFAVTSSSAVRLVASRTDAEIVATIYPEPTKAEESGYPLFPTAPPQSAVVRLQG